MTLSVEIAIMSDRPMDAQEKIAANILYEALVRVIDPVMRQFGADRAMEIVLEDDPT